MPRELEEWEKDVVIADLGEGYGIEDIAVTHKMPAQAVRQFVRSIPGDEIKLLYATEEQLDAEAKNAPMLCSDPRCDRVLSHNNRSGLCRVHRDEGRDRKGGKG
ncbi:MAG: hypothetical protein RI571_06500 [Roseovarius sp.]|nr:hypothetical protein [Roseovarius sp.]